MTTESAAETSTDNVYTIPAGHQGVTFISAAGGVSGPIAPLLGVTPKVSLRAGTALAMDWFRREQAG